MQLFKQKIASSASDVAGFWVPYHMFFLGHALNNSFAELRQLRLFRRKSVSFSNKIHESAIPVTGRYEYLALNEPGIEHHFVESLHRRFIRHLLWAQIEAAELFKDGITVTEPYDLLKAGINELNYYLLKKDGLDDGFSGFVNALMHCWKAIALYCYVWEMQGAPNMAINNIPLWKNLILQLSNQPFNFPDIQG